MKKSCKNNFLVLKIDFKVSTFKYIKVNHKEISKNDIDKIVEGIDYDDYDDFIDAKIISYQIEPRNSMEKHKWHEDIFWGRI